MIYVTHSLDEVTRLASDLILLKNGHVAAQGRVFDLLPDPGIRRSAGRAAARRRVPARR